MSGRVGVARPGRAAFTPGVQGWRGTSVLCLVRQAEPLALRFFHPFLNAVPSVKYGFYG